MMYNILRNNMGSDVGAIAQTLMDNLPVNARVEIKEGVPKATISNNRTIDISQDRIDTTIGYMERLGYEVRSEDNGFAVFDSKGVLQARADIKNKQFEFYANEGADPRYLTGLAFLYGSIVESNGSALRSYLQRREVMGEEAFNARLEKSNADLHKLVESLKKPIRLPPEDLALFQLPEDE
jgi:hypothetical protein